jgi:methyl-accepting chemotaxis protein
MADASDLIRAWEAVIREVAGLAGSVVSGGAQQLPLHREVEQLRQLLIRQVEFDRQLLSAMTSPARRVLDLSAQTTEAMAAQARAFREMSASMAQAADLLEQQAELLGAAIATMRDPVSTVRAASEAVRSFKPSGPA